MARMKALREKMRLPVMELRVGIHAGPVISGVVGKHKFTFDIWGDTVNTAALMEANGMPGRINVSETVAGHAHNATPNQQALSFSSPSASLQSEPAEL